MAHMMRKSQPASRGGSGQQAAAVRPVGGKAKWAVDDANDFVGDNDAIDAVGDGFGGDGFSGGGGFGHNGDDDDRRARVVPDFGNGGPMARSGRGMAMMAPSGSGLRGREVPQAHTPILRLIALQQNVVRTGHAHCRALGGSYTSWRIAIEYYVQVVAGRIVRNSDRRTFVNQKSTLE